MSTATYSDFTIDDGAYELRNGKTLKVWSQSDGQWACLAYDHGPFCRRCHCLTDDEILASLAASVIGGELEMEDHPTEGWRFHMTPHGKDRVAEILARDGLTPEDLKSWSKEQLREYLSR